MLNCKMHGLLLLTAALAALVAVAGAAEAAPDGCVKWCRHKHNPTEFFCCKADPNSVTHAGECPQRILTTGMATPCRDDRQCQSYEKCCDSASSTSTFCVTSITQRQVPRPVVSARFGPSLSGTSNNFDDLRFNETYEKGHEGWAAVGDMEPME